MPKAVAAEWFLRLFTTPDRATAIAGDMSEEGRVSWFDLLRTAAALFFRNAVEAPLRLLVLILFGVVVRFAFLIISGTLVVRSPNFRHSDPWVLGACYVAVNHVLITTLIGYVLVRFAKGRDITACMASAIIISALPLPSMMMSVRAVWKAHAVSAGHLALGILFSEAVPAFFLLASGVYFRKRFLTRV